MVLIYFFSFGIDAYIPQLILCCLYNVAAFSLDVISKLKKKNHEYLPLPEKSFYKQCI